MTSARRSLVATLLLAAVVLLGLAGTAGPAAAHAELASMTPTDGSAVDAMPPAVQLGFTEGVTSASAVSVIGPSGRELSTGRPATLGKVLTQKLSRTPDGPGGYTVRFQVMSEDGHLVYGAASFTVTGDGPGAAALAADGGGPAQPVVLLLGLVLVVLLALTGAGIGRLARQESGA
jgi:methionine-rich copper-binding protein CopC